MNETDDVIPLATEGIDPEGLLQQSQDEAVLEQAFLQLNETQRTLLSLTYSGAPRTLNSTQNLWIAC